MHFVRKKKLQLLQKGTGVILLTFIRAESQAFKTNSKMHHSSCILHGGVTYL